MLTASAQNFGPISAAAVELKPLTILVGSNGTGKSYLAMLAYALLRVFGQSRLTPHGGYYPAQGQGFLRLSAEAGPAGGLISVPSIPSPYQRGLLGTFTTRCWLPLGKVHL